VHRPRPKPALEPAELASDRGAPVVASPAADHISDEDLVARARTGDAWAHEVIFRRHSPGVLNMVVRMLGRREEARDIVQETFIAAFSSMEKLRKPAALRMWLRYLAVGQVHRVLRKRRFLQFIGLRPDGLDLALDVLADSAATPEMITELRMIDRRLRKLPAEERIAWILRYVEGEALEDVALVLGCSLATIKRRIKSAQDVLERHINSGGSDE
jgi:RNA polymerase sigma-70 factor, ECF subfamily